MCGRYLLLADDEHIQSWLQNNSRDSLIFTTGEVFPSQPALILHKNEQIEPAVAQWGVVKWDQKGRIINARQETIAKSPFFKEAFSNLRVIIPMSGFYEWDAEKQRYLIRNTHHSIQYAAGVAFKNEEYSFVMITQAAQSDFMAIHHRQPLLLHPDEIADYLNYQLPINKILSPRQYSFEIENQTRQTRLF